MTKSNPFSNKIYIFLYSIILLFAFVNTYNNVFNKKIDLNGDNAGYYILGKSIATGNGYSNIHTKNANGHNHFSPGYPTIIAATSLLFSDDIKTIKRVNGILFILSVFLIFLIAYSLTQNIHIAFIAGLFTLLNFHLLSYSTIMMSEISFLFFSSLSIFLFIKTKFTDPIYKNWIFIALIFSIIISYYIRPTGIALISGIGLILLIKRQWKYLITLTVSFLALALPWQIRSHSLGGSSYLRQLVRKNPYRPELGELEFADWFTRIFQNMERYITREIPSGIYNFFTVNNYNDDISQQEWLVGIITASLILFGLIRLKEKGLLILFYLLSTFGILLLWPSVWTGPRFIIPLIPFLLFLLIYGVTQLFLQLIQYVFTLNHKHAFYLVLAAASFFYGFKVYQQPLDQLRSNSKTEYPANFKNYFEIAEWVQANTPDTSVTCCRKGQLFYLHSEKKVSSFKSTLDIEDQINFLKKNGTDYVVIEQLGYSSTNKYLYPAVQRYPNKFKVIKHIKNPDTYLLKFSPDLGYTGEWENNQRSGYGTFVWENGITFAGNWKNNVRNGQGTLYFSDGRQLEGSWKDDKLHGPAVIKSKEGTIIERCEYQNNKKIKTY